MAREHQDSAFGHEAGEVNHRQGLPRARRAVKEETPLDVPPRLPERLRVLGEAGGLALDALQNSVAQHDLVAANRGQ